MAVLVFATALTAEAAPVTYDIVGRVFLVSGDSSLFDAAGITFNLPFTASLTYDPAALTDQLPADPIQGRYTGGPLGAGVLALSVAGRVFQSAMPDLGIDVFNLSNFSSLNVFSNPGTAIGTSPALSPGVTATQLGLILTSFDPSLFSDDSLPTGDFSAALFLVQRQMFLSLTDGVHSGQMTFQIDEVSRANAVVPEPASLLLLASGLAAVAARRYRKP